MFGIDFLVVENGKKVWSSKKQEASHLKLSLICDETSQKTKSIFKDFSLKINRKGICKNCRSSIVFLSREKNISLNGVIVNYVIIIRRYVYAIIYDWMDFNRLLYSQKAISER